jgi:pyruvate, water dikinase
MKVRNAQVDLAWIRWFDDIDSDDVASVGGKNASLGEMRQSLGALGIPVPDGFATTADAFRLFLDDNDLTTRLQTLLSDRDPENVTALEAASAQARALVNGAALPEVLRRELAIAYRELCDRADTANLEVAVRSSATAEDLPGASFAGAHESFLNISGLDAVLDAVRRCFASLYTPRAIRYREDMGFAHDKVALSVGVQRMLGSSAAVSGVMFTLDTETGSPDVVHIDAIWGLGENIVQGRVGPDSFVVHKATLAQGFRSIVRRHLGPKELRLVHDATTGRHENLPVSISDRTRFCLSDDDVLTLARWAVAIEQHYSKRAGHETPMDIEFARDGADGGLFIVQARPETVHSSKRGQTLPIYELTSSGTMLAEGLAIGDKIAVGHTRVVLHPKKIDRLEPGEVLVAATTDPDWEPIMKTASALITEHGGRTSHGAIVARELGIPAIVGVGNARKILGSARPVTVSCANGEVGQIFDGILDYTVEHIDVTALPSTRVYLNVGTPEQAFRLAQLPVDGVGLARMEFVFASWVKVHPLALTRYATLSTDLQGEIDEMTAGYTDKTEYFVDQLSQGIATIAAAFYPRPVILRFSDFKTNEYAHLLGGAGFEPSEANPMLGWRGASRYYHPGYEEGFVLELAAIKRVRDTMGLTNLKVMVPFCRTPEEGRKVIEVMRREGLVQGQNGLEVYVMAELPSNIILATEFAEIFDGFSIGSNDLTQLTLGLDRDSDMVAPLFDERNEAVKRSCADLIARAHFAGRTVGICGQAPSDYPEFAAFLVNEGIDSISVNPDALIRTKRLIAQLEQHPR